MIEVYFTELIKLISRNLLKFATIFSTVMTFDINYLRNYVSD